MAPDAADGRTAVAAPFCCSVAGLMPMSPRSIVLPALSVALLSSVPAGCRLHVRGGQARHGLACRRVDRIEPWRADRVADALNRGVDHAGVRIDVEDRRPGQAGCGGAEDERHEHDGLERSRPPDPFGEHREDQPEERHEEREEHDPDDVVLQRDEDVRRREDRLVVAEADEVLSAAIEEAADDRIDQRVHDDQQEPQRPREKEEQGAEMAAESATAGILARGGQDLPGGRVRNRLVRSRNSYRHVRPSPQWTESYVCGPATATRRYRNTGITRWYENGSE